MDPNYSQSGLLDELNRHLSGALSTLSLIQSTREETLRLTRSDSGNENIKEVLFSNKAIYALFINGKGLRASEAELRTITHEEHALYLDTTSGLLGIHLPGQEAQIQTVQAAGIDGVQDILGVMIANPHLNFGNVNIGLFLPHRVGMTPDAFRKTMAKIRYALQNGRNTGPLLLHFDRSHYTISESGHAWRISKDEGSLCFIKFLSVPKRFRQQRRT